MHISNQQLTIALCAGEASGDLLGAHLIDALKKYYPNSRFVGIGGPRMRAAGLYPLYDQEPLAVRGYFEVLGSLSVIWKIRRGLIEDLRSINPHVFIGIDSPDFNLPVAAKLRSAGIPCLHYVSPSVWAWKSGRVKKIVKQVNKVLCLFPMEPQLYRDAGGQAEFVGHPLAQMLPMDNSKVAVRERLKLELTAPVFTLMPGSRVSEIDYMAPVFLQAAALIADKLPEAVFLLPYPSAPVREALLKHLGKDEFKNLPVRLQAAKTELACMAADVVLVTSGTAALEVALCKRPMVISYRISALTYMLVKRKIKIPHIGLPNILLGKEVVPELIQKDATPEKLAAAVLDWYYHPVRSAELEHEFAKLHRMLLRNTDELAAYAVLNAAGADISPPAVYAAPDPEEETIDEQQTITANEPPVSEEAVETPAPVAMLPEIPADTPLENSTETPASLAEEPTVAAANDPEPSASEETAPPAESPSLFGRMKKWFGGSEHKDDVPPTPAREAAVRLAEDVAEAHSQQDNAPVRHVLEVDEEELSEAVSPIALPQSGVLQSNKSRIFDKYRETAEAQPDEAAPTPAPMTVAEPGGVGVQQSAANSESVYVRYINQVSMAWLPEHVSEKARQAAAEQAAREEAERQALEEAAARAEAERQAAEQAAREEAERQAAEQTAREEAERQAAAEQATPAPVRRRSVSSYSYNGRDKGKSMFF